MPGRAWERQKTPEKKVAFARIAGILAALGLAVAVADSSAVAADQEVAEAAPQGSVVVSMPVRLVADSQIHEFYGVPTFLSGARADRLSEVAIRPSQQRLFATMMLEAALRDMRLSPSAEIVHLGDAIDVSCNTEWIRFTSAMKAGGTSWTLTPGNHDGFFVGNAYPAVGDAGINMLSDKYGHVGWNFRCGPDSAPVLVAKNGADRLPKERLLVSYLGTRTANPMVQSPCGPGCVVMTNYPRFPRIYARISTAEPWTSFIMQAIDLSPKVCVSQVKNCPRTILILVDTSVYPDRPTFRRHPAGVEGGVESGQLSQLSRWLEELSSPQTILIVAGHHPLHRIRESGKARKGEHRTLKDTLCARATGAGRVSLYISAHTHDGWWRMHDCGKKDRLAELNVGSVLDWRAHFRSLEIVQTADGARFIRSEKFDLMPPPAVCDKWLINDSDPRSPLNQKLSVIDGDAVEQARDALNRGLRSELLEYRELHQLFRSGKTAPKLEFESSEEALKLIARELDNLTEETYTAAGTRSSPEALLHRLRKYEAHRQVADAKTRQQYYVCTASSAAKIDSVRQLGLKERRPPRGEISSDRTTVSVYGNP